MPRPKKTIKDTLSPDWKEKVLDLYKEGGSDVEVRVMLGISNDLWTRWMEEEQEFSETIKKGRELSYAWWLKQGRMLRDKDLNVTLWYMNMKNRFGWRDKQDVEVGGSIKIEVVNFAK